MHVNRNIDKKMEKIDPLTHIALDNGSIFFSINRQRSNALGSTITLIVLIVVDVGDRD